MGAYVKKKTIECGRCGKPIKFKGGKHRYCDECIKIVRKEQAKLRDWKRVVARRQKEAKERLCKCPACGVEFSRLSQGSKKKYCGSRACEIERMRRKFGYKHRYKTGGSIKHTLDYKTLPRYSEYYKRHDLKFKGQPFLSELEFDKLTAQPCYYCGSKGPNGIDRVDNTQGYVVGNCVPCCKHCNYVKGSLSLEAFKEWSTRFVRHQLETKTVLL